MSAYVLSANGKESWKMIIQKLIGLSLARRHSLLKVSSKCAHIFRYSPHRFSDSTCYYL